MGYLKYGYSSQKRNIQMNAKSFPSGIYPSRTLMHQAIAHQVISGNKYCKLEHCMGTNNNIFGSWIVLDSNINQRDLSLRDLSNR